MSGDSMFGRCEVCGKEGLLTRTYFRLPIKCGCHSPNHFDLVDHCPECVPVRPGTKIALTAEQAEALGNTLDEIASLRAENERLNAALVAAEKTIYDAETYFDMGSAKYAYKQVKDYQAKKEAARAALGKEKPS